MTVSRRFGNNLYLYNVDIVENVEVAKAGTTATTWEPFVGRGLGAFLFLQYFVAGMIG
jgi:hypothetical protein